MPTIVGSTLSFYCLASQFPLLGRCPLTLTLAEELFFCGAIKLSLALYRQLFRLAFLATLPPFQNYNSLRALYRQEHQVLIRHLALYVCQERTHYPRTSGGSIEGSLVSAKARLHPQSSLASALIRKPLPLPSQVILTLPDHDIARKASARTLDFEPPSSFWRRCTREATLPRVT
jgi:hypothetical protein